MSTITMNHTAMTATASNAVDAASCPFTRVTLIMDAIMASIFVVLESLVAQIQISLIIMGLLALILALCFANRLRGLRLYFT